MAAKSRFHEVSRPPIVALGATLATCSLISCVPDDTEPPPSDAATDAASATWSLATAAEPYAGSTIHVIGEDYPPLHAIDSVSRRFEDLTDIDVVVEGYEAEQAIQRLTLDIASGEGHYDLVAQVYFDMGRLVTQEQLRPLSAFLDDAALRDPSFLPSDDLFPVWRTMGWYDGVPYGFPMMVLTMYVWYRADLFSDSEERAVFRSTYGYDLAPPRTWSQYRDIAEHFTRPGSGLYGTLIQGRRHIALWQEYINFLYSFGGAILDTRDPSEYGPIVINSPAAIEATEYYKNLLTFSPPDALSYTWDDALSLTQQGRVAILLMWNDALYSLEDSTQSRVAGRMGYAVMPEGSAGIVHQIGGQSLYIPVPADNPEPAFLFMQWLMGHEPQVAQQLLGGSSPRATTYEESSVLELPWTRATMAALDQTHPAMLYTFPESLRLGEVIQIAISDALSERKSVGEALDWAALEMKRILGEKAELAYPPNDDGGE